MIAVTFGSLCRILAVSSETAAAMSAFSDGAVRELEKVTVISGMIFLLVGSAQDNCVNQSSTRHHHFGILSIAIAMINICDDEMTTLDIATVRAFLLVAELQSFTRAAEALRTTQAAVSMKLQRLEAVVGKRLVERSPRAGKFTAVGAGFFNSAWALMNAHDRAL